MKQPVVITRKQPLRLRYLLHAHLGGVDAARAGKLSEQFAASTAYLVAPAKSGHQQYIIRRDG